MATVSISTIIKVNVPQPAVEVMHDQLLYMLNVLNPDDPDSVEDYEEAYAHYNHHFIVMKGRHPYRSIARIVIYLDDLLGRLHSLGYRTKLGDSGKYNIYWDEDLVAICFQYEYDTVDIIPFKPIRGVGFYRRDNIAFMRFRNDH